MAKNGYSLFYNFLIDKEKNNAGFFIEEVSSEIKIKKNTILKYIGNPNIYNYFSKNNSNNQEDVYFTKGISKLSESGFNEKLSQGIKKKNDLDILIDKMSKKSIENFILAIEIYNRPSLENKVEAFCILMMNSWEILLKMLLIKNHNNKDIVLQKNSGHTISISECISKLYPEEQDVVKKNLTTMIQLRNEASHLLIEEIRPSLSELFQANIINYIEKCHENNINLNIDNNSGMLTLFIPGKNKIEEVYKIYGEKTHTDIINFLKNLEEKKKELNSNNFTCDITYSVYLAKKEKDSDVTFKNGNNGSSIVINKINTNIQEIYKYKFKQIIRENKIYIKNLNQHTLNLFIKKHNIKNNPEYHYSIATLNLYSQSFINFLKNNF